MLKSTHAVNANDPFSAIAVSSAVLSSVYCVTCLDFSPLPAGFILILLNVEDLCCTRDVSQIIAYHTSMDPQYL